jgi:hypothetical protein
MESPIQGIQQGMLFGQANLLLGSWYTLVPLSAVQYRVAMQIIQPSSLYVLNIHSQVDLLPSRTITMILSQEFFVRVAKISCVMKRLNLINQTCKVHTENGRQPKHIWHVINEVLSHLYIYINELSLPWLLVNRCWSEKSPVLTLKSASLMLKC